MPIQDKDLGKYQRPGIFIEEINNSVVTLPVQDTLVNLVPGFSKKGPVNRPVYVSNSTDFIKIFGEIDKSLERKGSFFHRTCLKMIESGPIWALNLLTTDDDRDKLNWKTISLASYYDNDIKKEMPYSRVFNKQDFWKRDDESFLDYVNDPTPENDKLLHITNMGDKTITTLMFKSSTQGFDITAEDWYGGPTKVPAYIHPKDWVSDYLVTVVVIEGDWTDYDKLSIDSNYGKYFDTTGLLKDEITDFLNESTVTTLAYYDASLIPYFKDSTGRNMYIKTLINNETDTSGLFCTVNEDVLLDADNPTGRLDIIGATMVNTEKSSIDFLSYQEDIVENITYPQTNLDSNGNVFGNYSSEMDSAWINGRTGSKTNGYVDGLAIGDTGSTLLRVHAIVQSGVTSAAGSDKWIDVGLSDTGGTPEFNPPHSDYAVNDVVYFTKDFQTIKANVPYYVVSVDQDFHSLQVSETLNGVPVVLSEEQFVEGGNVFDIYLQRVTMELNFTTPVSFNIDGGTYTVDTGITEIVLEPLDIELDGSVIGSDVKDANRIDVLYLSKGDDATVNILKGTQAETGAEAPSFNLSPSDYIILGYVELTTASSATGNNSTDTIVNVEYTPIAVDGTGYAPYTTSQISITGDTSGTINYVMISFLGSSGSTDNSNYEQIRIRQTYNELVDALEDGKGLIINFLTGEKVSISGIISADYSPSSNAFIKIPVGTDSPLIYFDGAEILLYFVDNEFVISDSIATDRLFTTTLPVSLLTGSGQTTNAAGVIGKYSDFYLDFYNGIINNWDFGYQNNDTGSTTQIYLKMWMEDEEMYIDFVSDKTGISPEPISAWEASYGSSFTVWSQDSNYKQTVEIESLDATKLPGNIFEFSVDKTRYSEVIKGSFIEGYYESVTGGTRKLARVTSTLQDPNNASNKIIKTDGPIAVTSFVNTTGGVDYSTTLYPSIDVYVDTYKGISLPPFKIHTDSIPNKTESRQSEILDVIGKTTNLAKALANKNKISWRYLVDSFGLGLTDKSKQQLVDLCGLKLNCLGFINMPSVKQLKKSDNPSFTKTDGTLSLQYLQQGGDDTKSPSFLYTFGEGIGATCVGYFFPYLTIDDDGQPLDFPPSSYAASTYMKKFLTTQSGIEAWTIAAGITNGRITGVGDVEMDFNDDDIVSLTKMGANAIVKKKDAGYCIDNESTAQVFPYSSLSVIHSREVLIELENSMYDMLLRYQWKFNTKEVRSEIRRKANKICKDLQTKDALYDYNNVIDETNNTNYIIDLQMGVLDTYIEIIKGMGTIVNNITILKKGDIQSGGFL